MKTEDLLNIAHTYGNPVYVYDAEKISSQYQRLTNAFASVPKLRINYAMKALSNIAVLKLMKSLGAGLDTVSIQEVQLGLCRSEERRVGKECRSRWSPYH